jgi:branched-chain amino acid transport system substrate-binding protein
MKPNINPSKSNWPKWSIGAVAIAIVISSFACQRPYTEQGQNSPKIGACLSLTGPISYWSQQIKRGLDLALEHANASSLSKVPKIIYEDNQGDPKIAVTAFQKLANVDHVSTIITAHTPISKAQRPLAGQSKIPLLGTVVSAVDFGLENEWCFLDWPSQAVLTPPLARHSYQVLRARKAATLVVNDAYGTDGAKIFAEAFTKEGGKVVATETMGPNDTDFRGQLTKIITSRPDVLYMVARDAALANAVRQARQAGYNGKIVGPNAFDAPIVWNTLGDLANGIIFANIQIDTNSEGVKLFDSDYRKKYSEPPDWVSLYGYSIGQYLIKAVQDGGTDTEKIRVALSTLNTDTLRGHLEMNASREVNQRSRLYLRQSGENILVPVQGAQAAIAK